VKKRTYRDVIGKYEGKRPLGRLRLRCEDNIKVKAQRKMGLDRYDVNIKIISSFCEGGNKLPVSIK
jgi:hypothetical protein